MDDLISRQAAIERIDAVFPVDHMRSEYAQGIASGAALAKTNVSENSLYSDIKVESVWERNGLFL